MVEAQVWPSQLAECAGSSVLLSSMEEAECGQVMMAEAWVWLSQLTEWAGLCQNVGTRSINF